MVMDTSGKWFGKDTRRLGTALIGFIPRHKLCGQGTNRRSDIMKRSWISSYGVALIGYC